MPGYVSTRKAGTFLRALASRATVATMSPISLLKADVYLDDAPHSRSSVRITYDIPTDS